MLVFSVAKIVSKDNHNIIKCHFALHKKRKDFSAKSKICRKDIIDY